LSGKYLKEYITISVLAIIFTVCSLLPIGSLASVFAAFLVALTGYTVTRHHYGFVGFVCVCILATSAIITHELSATLIVYSEIIIYSLALGVCFNLKLSGIKTIGVLSAFHIAYTVASIAITGSGDDFLPVFTESIQSMYPLYKDFMSQTDFNAVVSSAVTIFVKFMPGFFVIAAFVAASIYFGLFRLIMKITKTKTHYGNFSDCRPDKSISIIFFVILSVNMLLPTGNYYSDVTGNVILITSVIFFVFGLAFVLYWLNQRVKNTSKRKLIFALVMLSPLFSAGIPFMLLSFLGAADGIFDFRKNSGKNLNSKE